MSPRTIITAAEWTFGAESAKGAPQGIFGAQCITCGSEVIPMDDDRLPVEVWAFKHTGANPSHRQYVASVHTFWHVSPPPGNPYHELADDRQEKHHG